MLSLGPLPLGVVTQVLNLDQSDQLRLTGYARAWATYWNRNWTGVRLGGDPVVGVNRTRLLVDKSVSYFCKGGFTVDVPEALEEVVVPYLDEVWRVNDRELYLYWSGTMGAVTGDVFTMVTLEPPDPKDAGRYSLTGGRIRIVLLSSDQCFPTWDPLNKERMTSVRIETLYPDPSSPTRAIRRFTQLITDDQIIEWWHGEPPVIRPNVLGRIPVVHHQNLPVACEFWGASDLEPIRELQEAFNEVVTDQDDIVHYHASPVVVVIGAKFANGERGPNQIWSGFPQGTEVKELGGGDLTMLANHRDFLQRSMEDLAEIPQAAIQTVPISNTSASALQMQYGPLEDKTARKRVTYGKGLREIHELVLRIGELTGSISLPRDLCRQCGGRILRVPDPELGRTVLRCFEVDPSTLEWVTPENVDDIREAKRRRLGQEEDAKAGPNTPPPPPPDPKAPPVPPPVDAAEEKRKAELKKFVPVSIPTVIQHPLTGQVTLYPVALKLLPTGCRASIALDPFETNVEFVGGLPRDEQLFMTLCGAMLDRRVVSRAWVRRAMARYGVININEVDDIAREVREEAKEDPMSKTQGPGYAAPGVAEMNRGASKAGGHNEKADQDTT